VWVLLALFVGGEIFGFLGVLLAVPVAAVLKIFVGRAMARYRESAWFMTPAEAVLVVAAPVPDVPIEAETPPTPETPPIPESPETASGAAPPPPEEEPPPPEAATVVEAPDPPEEDPKA
jgi:hypothetical protein